MNQARSIGRVAIDRWLRVIRMPIDVAAHLMPDDRGPRNAAMLAVDRADATVRAAAGNLLNDDVLREDAARRRLAAEERQRALALHQRAEEKSQESDGRLVNDLERAERLRERAERDAEAARESVSEAAAMQTSRAKKTAAAQRRATDEALESRTDAVEKQAKRKRLEVLDEQGEALDREADALTATDEAQRLARAASSAKAARKGTA
jgi:hypothetical protein